jgi:hypothetical protein
MAAVRSTAQGTCGAFSHHSLLDSYYVWGYLLSYSTDGSS